MFYKRSAESLQSSTDDEEHRFEPLSLQASLSRIEYRPKNDIISPEDIAAVAFARIFNEDSHFPPNLSTIHEISARKRTLFNEDSDSTIGRIYPKTPIVRSPAGYQTTTATGHGIPKHRHKSPSNRAHSLHPPLSTDGISSWGAADSVRKTKSTALPTIINTSWPRNTSASTPEMKVDDQGIVIERLPSNHTKENSRRVYLINTTCYYNFRLIYIILNCFTLVIGLVYLGAAVVLWLHKELVLVIVDYRVYVSSIICLFCLAIILLAIATSGLCFVRSGPKKTAAHAGCSLVLGAVLVALAFLQSAAQLSVEVDAEFRMLSTIHPGFVAINIWDYLHRAFKCCGVRGYLDWCQKPDANSKTYTSAEDFLRSFICNLPESCCLNNRIEFGVPKNIDYMSCIATPTPFNTHKNGCLTPTLIVISYLGKTYRIANFVTAFILHAFVDIHDNSSHCSWPCQPRNHRFCDLGCLHDSSLWGLSKRTHIKTRL